MLVAERVAGPLTEVVLDGLNISSVHKILLGQVGVHVVVSELSLAQLFFLSVKFSHDFGFAVGGQKQQPDIFVSA